MSLSRNAEDGTVRFMAGLAPDENPREMAQEHSQGWPCHWAVVRIPDDRGHVKGNGLWEKDVGSC